MPDPMTFISSTARTALPFIFPGQAQKEVTINEAYARIDALLHCTVEGAANAPPPEAVDGQCWLISGTPAGPWTDHPGEIACRQAGTWLFVEPVTGLRVFDRETASFVHYDGTWRRPEPLTAPSGGSIVDSEARAAIAALVAALATTGVLPEQ